MSLMPFGIDVVAENVSAYSTVAASMFWFWDYLLTFGQEVDLIWRAKLSWVSVMFIVIRYLTFFIKIVHLVFCSDVFGLVPVGVSGCLLWLWFQVLSGQVLFLAVEVLFITRVYAFYGRRKVLLVPLIVLLAGEISAMFVLVAITLPKAQAIPSPLTPNIHASACIGISMPIAFSSLWVPPLIMQGILFSLVIFKFIRTMMNSQVDNPPLLVVFVRDNIWAFLLIFVVSLWAALSYELTAHQGEIALTWNYSILGFCGSRLILNLRSAAQEGSSHFSTVQQDVSVNMAFKTNPGSRVSRLPVSRATDARAVESEGTVTYTAI